MEMLSLEKELKEKLISSWAEARTAETEYL